MGTNGNHWLRLAYLIGAIAMSSVLVFVGLAGSQARAQALSAQTCLTPDIPLSEPRPMLWQTVSVHGTVDRILEEHAFTLRSRTAKQGLLIVHGPATGGDPPLEVGQEVEVVGTVRILSRGEVARLADAVGLQLGHDGRPSGHGDHPYILAFAVRASNARHQATGAG